jgi:hypothetical protein
MFLENRRPPKTLKEGEVGGMYSSWQYQSAMASHLGLAASIHLRFEFQRTFATSPSMHAESLFAKYSMETEGLQEAVSLIGMLS